MRRKTPRTEHQVGNYRLIRLIAEGGMGQVFEAAHIELGRRAAVKLLRPDIAQNEETAARFFTEARAASLVAHAGLVQVYEYGHLEDGGAYIVMEYVQGELLRDRIQRSGGRLPPALAIPIGRQIASALHAAHDKGVVHRDLKPENIKLVPDDEALIGERAKILDFGIAKMLHSDAERGPQQTLPGQLLGTPVYMAPEQAGANGRIGLHTDVYSLGVVLFELLAGHPPFVAEEATQLIGQHLFASPPLLRSKLPDADLALDELLQRMLAKTPELRPTMQTVANELGQIDRRLRSKILGPISNAEDSQQVETVVFRKIRSGRLENLYHLLMNKRKLWLFGTAGALAVTVISAGIWLVFKRSSTPTIARGIPSDNDLSKTAKEPPSGSAVPPTPTSASGAIDVQPASVVRGQPEAPRNNALRRPPDSSPRLPERPPQKNLVYNPNDVSGTITLAHDLLKKGNYNKAVEVARSIQNRSPLQAWRIIGIAACRSKNIELAKDSYALLDDPGQQYIIYACKLNGIEKTMDGFRLKK